MTSEEIQVTFHFLQYGKTHRTRRVRKPIPSTTKSLRSTDSLLDWPKSEQQEKQDLYILCPKITAHFPWESHPYPTPFSESKPEVSETHGIWF